MTSPFLQIAAHSCDPRSLCIQIQRLGRSALDAIAETDQSSIIP